ncbi:MAG: hypothetical protein MUF61_02275, partial [archaeon]|nr:hypothetical protein [archaeon]
GLTYHAQLRFEYASKEAGQRRLQLMKNSGCTGITFAVESANPTIREEVLNRHMHQSMIVETMQHLADLGLKCRIEQMIGLPYGATKDRTPVNLEADLETLKFNVDLRKETGLPTVAWASIFSPYRGTVLGEYCRNHGFYRGDYADIPRNFFGRSTLHFPREWTGPSLNANSKGAWLSDEENEGYKDQMKLLREVFQLAARLPNGHEFARKYVSREGLGTGGKAMEMLAKDLKTHTYNHEMYGVEGE